VTAFKSPASDINWLRGRVLVGVGVGMEVGCDMNRPIELTCDVMNEVTKHSFIRNNATFKPERA